MTTPHLSADAKANLPQHVAIIMDGNGRRAKQRTCRASGCVVRGRMIFLYRKEKLVSHEVAVNLPP
jgi:undecaprenyl pyrophosphate synthase